MIAHSSGLADSWIERETWRRRQLEHRLLEEHLKRLSRWVEWDNTKDNEFKRWLRQAHREECRQAFARPPKKRGLGRQPLKKWGPRRR